MKNKSLFLIALLCSIIFSIKIYAATSLTSDDLLGYWMSPKNDLLVQCYKQNNKYYGKIVWFKKYEHVYENPENKVPEKTWMNTIIMKDFVPQNNMWTNGTIHDLKSNKTYDAEIKQISKTKISVRGYIFIPLFGESIEFTKYENKYLPYFNNTWTY
jgi:uncharacterized protein (DUF2147 family)